MTFNIVILFVGTPKDCHEGLLSKLLGRSMRIWDQYAFSSSQIIDPDGVRAEGASNNDPCVAKCDVDTGNRYAQTVNKLTFGPNKRNKMVFWLQKVPPDLILKASP